MIDIIVPVYRGYSETRRCIESVLASSSAVAATLIVIDDCSPDPKISNYLADLANTNHIELLSNATNCGFVASVNRGMALHLARDVILLNSDTEVANNWIDRLRWAAYAAPNIATVTPISNNATICSYPFEGWTGGVPGSMGLAGLDLLFSKTNPDGIVDIPTAIGFCMYIRRACLDQIGLFDEALFGRGYGEENDFSMRAGNAGWRNVAATNVFVFHQGSVSFGEDRHALMASGSAALLARHPEYLDQVRSFILADPLAAFRLRIDAARSEHGKAESRHVDAEHSIREQYRSIPTQTVNRAVAVLVAYDESINPLKDMKALMASVSHVVIVDNTPAGHKYLSSVDLDHRLTIITNQNVGGLAGAYNAALKQVAMTHSDATHVLFLDDDSDISSVGEFLRSEITQRFAIDPDFAAVAPSYVDRQTGLPGAHIQLSSCTIKILPRVLLEPTPVTFLINSMSLWRLSALRHIGQFSTVLQLDHVDTDYCLRAKLMGYKLALNPYVKFMHAIGRRRQYRFLGITMQAGGHSPVRRKMIGRNTILLAKHYGFRFPSFAALCCLRLIYECLGITIAEDRKWEKLSALLSGALHGVGTSYSTFGEW